MTTEATVTPIDRQIATRIVAATMLRDAVKEFNLGPPTMATIDALRERMLQIADFLAPPPNRPLRSLTPEDFGHSVKA